MSLQFLTAQLGRDIVQGKHGKGMSILRNYLYCWDYWEFGGRDRWGLGVLFAVGGGGDTGVVLEVFTEEGLIGKV